MLMHDRLFNLLVAGMDGSRTHRGPQSDPPPVLKTGKPTGTLPLPISSIPDGEAGCKGLRAAGVILQEFL